MIETSLEHDNVVQEPDSVILQEPDNSTSTEIPMVAIAVDSTQSTKPPVLLLKIMYLLLFGAVGSYEPFISVFFNSGRGLTLPQVGVLVSIQPFVGVFANPMWTSWADKHKSHVLTLATAAGCSVAAFVALSIMKTFWLSFCFMIIFSFFRAPLSAMLDALALQSLQGGNNLYGRFRMFGGLGFGIMALLIGRVMDTFGFVAMFISYGICMTGFVFCVRQLVAIPLQVPDAPKVLPSNISVLSMLRRKDVLGFALTVFILGIAHHTISGYLFIYLAEAAQATRSSMGLLIAVSIVSEVPFFYFSPRILDQFGYDVVLIISHIAYIFRLIGYTTANDVFFALLLQLLHGLTFACMWSASVVRANTMAPHGMEATLQGILASSFQGLGGAVGAVVGGIIYSAFGAIELFRLVAFVIAISLALFIITGQLHKQSKLKVQV